MPRLLIGVFVFVLLGSPAAAITLPFPGGAITEEKDEDGKPTGNKLYMSKEIKLPKSVDLAAAKSETFAVIFKTFFVTLTDLNSDSEESIHVEINGKQVRTLNVRFEVYDRQGKKRKLADATGSGNGTTGTVTRRLDYVLDLIPETDASRDFTGYSVRITNGHAYTMTVTSLRIGVDAESITITDPDPSPPKIPLPGSFLLLGSSAAGLGAFRLAT